MAFFNCVTAPITKYNQPKLIRDARLGSIISRCQPCYLERTLYFFIRREAPRQMDETSFQELVLGLYRDGKWREIVDLRETEDKYQGRRLLWVWPSLNDLDWLKELLPRYKLKGIASMGCGSGLLEWIIQRHSGCNVIGVEKDKSWWHSRYSPPAFLKDTIYVDEDESKIHLPADYALLFCYFNNGAAFEKYLSGCYEGRVVIVIGPRQGIYRTTDPLPFDHKFNRLGWNLRDTRQLDNGKDLAVLYTK